MPKNNNCRTDNSQRYSKLCLKIMELRMRDYTIISRQFRLPTTKVIQCSCMPLISLSWTLFKPPGLWDNFNLDSILGKGGKLFKFISKFRYLGIEGLPQEFFIENSLINVQFLENKTGQITAAVYLLYIAEIVNSVHDIETGALLIVNNYILALISQLF